VILDRAEDLRNLAREANQAAGIEKESTALAYVEETIKRASEDVSGYGIATAPWIEQLSLDSRTALRAAAAELEKTVRPLRELTDQELAAYGHSAERGRLAVVRARATDLRERLQEAHEALLAGWADRVWPPPRMAELHVRQQLSATQDAALVKRALSRLSVAKSATGDADLRVAQAEIPAAEEAARRLEATSVPDEVVKFWQEVEEAGPEGVPLTNLSPDLYRWLQEHEAGGHFRLSSDG
jgi:hypothetical protein